MEELWNVTVGKVQQDFLKGKSNEKQDRFDLILIISAIVTLWFVCNGWYVIAIVPAIVTFVLALMDDHTPSKVINFCLAIALTFSVYTQCDNWVLFLTFAQVFANFGMRIGKIDLDDAVVIQGLLGAIGTASIAVLTFVTDSPLIQDIAFFTVFVCGIAGVYVAIKMGNVIQGSVVSLIIGMVNIMGLRAGYPLLVGVLNAGMFIMAIGSISRQVKHLNKNQK
ncbi:MAG: hypothetical protein WC851_02595 [Candidatus Shapirobacteria bacterium]|jgi:hypothetical protein